jgi:KDO2-lipid IV(A) lauroyltransferase
MGAITYYLSIPFIYLIALLPFPVLYLLSDFIYLVLYKLLGYRTNVVRQNLSRSFPEKSLEELRIIERKFFRHLCDVMVETTKSLVISKNELQRRFLFTQESAEILDGFAAQNRSYVIVLGHYGNWEWGVNAFALTRRPKLYGLYMPLKNHHYDQLMRNVRNRFGCGLISVKTASQDLTQLPTNPPHAIGFLGDQAARPERGYWMTFLHQDTSVFYGTEAYARKLNYPVVYVSIDKLRRGYYQLHARIVCKNPAELNENEITEQHVRLLENDIKRKPEIWLWSHKRWKHIRPNSVKPVRTT